MFTPALCLTAVILTLHVGSTISQFDAFLGTTTKQETVTQANPDPCAGSTWEEWREWSDCTKPCGSCGTHQRFRACNKTSPDCLCSGTAFEKVPCNLDVCIYPERTCCEGFFPQSNGGKFQCLANNTVTNRMRL